MEDQFLIPADPSAPANGASALDQWLGKHQAFCLNARKCSAADAHSLREIRQLELYRAVNLSWPQFVARYVGVSPYTANQIVARLNEFGDSYFNLGGILRISTRSYRALAPSIQDNTVDLDGRRIPITPENYELLAEALRVLHAKLQKRPPRERGSLICLRPRLERCLTDMAGRLYRGLNKRERDTMLSIMDDASAKLQELYRYF